MDTKKLLSVLFISFFLFSVTFSQSSVNIKIAKSDSNNFFITLELDKSNKLSEIKIQGFAFAKGKSSTFDIVYNINELKKHKGDKFELHELSGETDYALYTITTFDKDGNRMQYPSQKVNMPDGYSFSSRF